MTACEEMVEVLGVSTPLLSNDSPAVSFVWRHSPAPHQQTQSFVSERHSRVIKPRGPTATTPTVLCVCVFEKGEGGSLCVCVCEKSSLSCLLPLSPPSQSSAGVVPQWLIVVLSPLPSVE